MWRNGMNTSAKGNRVECLARDILLTRYGKVEMFRLSKGAFDRIAERRCPTWCPTMPVPDLNGSGARPLEPINTVGARPCTAFSTPCPCGGSGTERRAIQIKANAWGMGAASMKRAWEVAMPEPISREWWMRRDGGRGVPEITRWSARRLTSATTWVEIPIFPEDKLDHEPATGMVKMTQTGIKNLSLGRAPKKWSGVFEG